MYIFGFPHVSRTFIFSILKNVFIKVRIFYLISSWIRKKDFLPRRAPSEFKNMKLEKRIIKSAFFSSPNEKREYLTKTCKIDI